MPETKPNPRDVTDTKHLPPPSGITAEEFNKHNTKLDRMAASVEKASSDLAVKLTDLIERLKQEQQLSSLSLDGGPIPPGKRRMFKVNPNAAGVVMVAVRGSLTDIEFDWDGVHIAPQQNTANTIGTAPVFDGSGTITLYNTSETVTVSISLIAVSRPVFDTIVRWIS